jgi:hypothetical protein
MYITNAQITDGFGSQFQSILSVIFVCWDEGKEFVYSPLFRIQHNYANDPDFMDKLENVMNLKNNFVNIDQLTEEERSLVERKDDHHYKNKIDAYIEKFLNPDSLKKIRHIFWANKDRDVFKNGKVNVAIHIRRPNHLDEELLEEQNKHFGTGKRFHTDQYFLSGIKHLREKYPPGQVLFHIYSQKNARSNFNAFNAPDIVLHIDEDVGDSFVQMVAADVLITSASSLSYVAGWLSEGIVFSCPFWHTPLPNWVKT